MEKVVIAWYEGQQPPLNTGDKVFVADRVQNESRVLETVVSKVPVDVIRRDGQFLLFWRGWYDLQTMTFPGEYLPPTWCHAKYVFTNRAQAVAAAAWFGVADVTPDQWLVALGDRGVQCDEPGNIDTGCELQSGMVNDGTSEIRDWLYEAREWGGLREVDRSQLQGIIDKCWNRPEALNKADSVLAVILKKLRLKW